MHPMLKVPTLLMHGSDDKICSPEGSREFASKNKNVELKIWDGGYHELHNEPFKEEVFRYIINWINKTIIFRISDCRFRIIVNQSEIAIRNPQS